MTATTSTARLSGALLLALVLTLALGAPAAANEPQARSAEPAFEGFVVDAGFTQVSFEDFRFAFAPCGTYPHELTCTWSVRLTLHSYPERRCVDSTPDSVVVWDSGPQSGNGEVHSGPQSFPLEGCLGQSLIVNYEFHKTFGPWEGPGPAPLLLLTGGAGTIPMAPFGLIEEAERRVIEANLHPGSGPPMPVPEAGPRVARNCRSVLIGERRYAFRFRGIGCWKASRLLTGTRFGNTPNGYRCVARAGGLHCSRLGRPGKFFEWYVPRRDAAGTTGA